MQFEILYRDAEFVAINKPAGWLVHRTGISEDKVFILQELRNQLGQYLYPVHRLDRGTSGVLLFAFSPESARQLQASLEAESSQKTYLAILRGWLPAQGTIDVPLEKDGDGDLQSAQTSYQSLAKAELAVAVDRYASARYTLAAIRLHTGRMHQIRRHFAHLRHPVLSDRKRGDRHHNQMWEREFGMRTMQLFAWRLQLVHPVTQKALLIQAPAPDHLIACCKILGIDLEEFAQFCWE